MFNIKNNLTLLYDIYIFCYCQKGDPGERGRSGMRGSKGQMVRYLVVQCLP